jgi:hypothetical protein
LLPDSETLATGCAGSLDRICNVADRMPRAAGWKAIVMLPVAPGASEGGGAERIRKSDGFGPMVISDSS